MTQPTSAVGLSNAAWRSGDAARERVSRLRGARRFRSLRISLVLGITTILAVCVSVSVGDLAIPLHDVIGGIVGAGDEATAFVVQELRLPRALVGVLVGIALAGSGAIFQSFARNPLASPDILGITAGASVGAVFVITTMGGGYALTAVAASLGALVIALLIYVLAYRRGISSYRFVLVGIGLAAMAAATTAFLITRSVIFVAADATAWLTGTLTARGWETAAPLALALAILVPLTIVAVPRLEVLQLGNETAEGLGVGVERSQLSVVLVGVALAGAGVAAAGPIAFVALMAPAIARRLVRSPLALAPAMLTGAVLVTVADVIGRRVFAPTEIQVGVITGIIGAPYLLWLLVRANRVGRGG
jgi:iron complex transport system permease protein